MSDQIKKSEVSFFNANFTSIISVTLVLVILGVVALFMIAGNNLSNSIRGNAGFAVVIDSNASETQINDLKRYWSNAPYLSSVRFVSNEEALRNWQRDTGEDLMELLGVNPLNHEFDVRLKPEYANSDSLHDIIADVNMLPGVESVSVQQDLIDSVNDNIQRVSALLLIVAAALIIISFALINNTIQLSVYSKRFLIHTMKLVGATPGFIRKPFVVSSVINGVISAILADALLCMGIYYGLQFFSEESLLSTAEIAITLCATFLLGIVICAVAAAIATTKYIRLDYDALFKR